MYKYDDAILKKLQHEEVNMLKVFDTICKNNQIKYFVNSGTAIGAIRHNGFIPWDDDIDIGMMREEYNKLKLLPQSEWDKVNRDVFLADPFDSSVIHRSIYPRLYKRNTVFETEYHYKYSRDRDHDDEHLPIWIDIFIYDKCNSLFEVKLKSVIIFFLKKLYYYSRCEINILKKDPLKLKILCLLKKMIFRVLNCVKTPEKYIYNVFLKLVDTPKGHYVTCYEFDYRFETIKSFCNYNDMFPVIEVKFEDMITYIQKNYNEMLKSIYGNYMELPPEHKRVNHPPQILDFGDGSNVIEEVYE